MLFYETPVVLLNGGASSDVCKVPTCVCILFTYAADSVGGRVILFVALNYLTSLSLGRPSFLPFFEIFLDLGTARNFFSGVFFSL